MRFRHGAASDVGQVRQGNEDGYLVADPLFAVADGMGGHRAGEVASATALAALRESVNEVSSDALIGGVEQANLEVFRRAAGDPGLAGMGTTLCAIGPVVDGSGERIGIVNVGDSRVYVHTTDGLTQVTEDHSLVEAMVRVGQLSPEQAAAHPKRNVVTRALGIEPTVDVDCWALTPAPGDRLLLCSDGLFGEVDDATIASVLAAEPDPSAAATELVRLANEAGGRDNITVVVVDVEPDVDLDAVPEGSRAVPLAQRVERLSAPSDDLALLGDGEVEAAPTSPYLPSEPAGPPEPALPPGPVLSREPDPKAVESSRQEESGRRQGSPRITWRVLLFVGVLLVVVGVAVGAVLLTSESDPATTVEQTTTVSTTIVSTTVVSTSASASSGQSSFGSASSTAVPTETAPTVPGG